MSKENSIYEELREKIKYINDLFRENLIELSKKFEKPQIFKFDLVNEEKRELVISNEGEKLIYAETKEIEGETPGDNSYINYYWIEYDDTNNKKQKLTWFFKSYDLNTLNLHVIPGIYQLWERKNIDENKELPILKADTGELLNIVKRKEERNHMRFIERIDNFDWIPISNWPFADKIDNSISIIGNNPRELYSKFSQDYIRVIRRYRDAINNKIKGNNIKTCQTGGKKEDSSTNRPDYRFLAWINCTKNGKRIASLFFHRNKIYRHGGFLMLFGQCGFAPDNKKCYSIKYHYDEWFCSDVINMIDNDKE